MIIDLTKLSHADLEQLATDLSEEQSRRRDLREVEALVWRHVNTGGAPVETLTAAAAGLGLPAESLATGADAALEGLHEDGAPWTRPIGAHVAYPQGATVTHGGKTWVSLSRVNTWEPPIGWREVTEDGEIPEWVKPSSTEDAYQKGERVTFQGQVWESVWDNPNTWSPTEFPDAWKLIEGEQ